MKFFDTYLFDFDGTLVDSMPSYTAAMLSILDEKEISYEKDLNATVTPLGVLKTAKYFVEVLGYPGSVEEVIGKMKEKLMDAYFYHVPAKKNVPETLRALKERGASLCVLTASPHVTLDPCLKRLGLYDLFDSVWSCDDFSTSKADPEIYRAVARKLHKKAEEILFLHDNLGADKTALSAGMKVCGVFDESSKEDTDQIRTLCDFYIDDFRQLLDF